MEKKRVLMICLGNICRSPIAEAVFLKHIKEKDLEDKWEVQSAALVGYHTGRAPDSRTITTLTENGITDYSHKARTVTKLDFDHFDWIFGMDDDNISALNNLKPRDDCRASVELLGKYDPTGELIIRDPYYDGDLEGFKCVYEQCDRSIKAFLESNSG